MMPIIVRYFIPTIGVRVKLMEFSSEKGETSKIIADLVLYQLKKIKLRAKSSLIVQTIAQPISALLIAAEKMMLGVVLILSTML